MQSECASLRFHHVAHHQLFPMNYLLAALHIACPHLDVLKPIKNLQVCPVHVSFSHNQEQAAPPPVCWLNYLPVIDVG